MRKEMFLVVILTVFMSSACCLAIEPTAQVDSTTTSYAGSKARIAVADFEVKAAKASGAIGSGLREMLVTALMNSNRFSVVERQVLSAVMQEQELAASGAAESGTAAQRGKIKTADIIITAAVTEFEPKATGGKAGIGGGAGIGRGVLGAMVGGALNKAHMALDIRVVDTSTSEILAATRVQGSASDISGGAGLGFVGSWALGGGLSGYANTPMEKAIRVCIVEAVNYISQSVPASYYKY